MKSRTEAINLLPLLFVGLDENKKRKEKDKDRMDCTVEIESHGVK